jgi:hypothetical protein
VGRGGDPGDQHWRDACQSTRSNTSDDTSDQNEFQVLSGRLQCTSDQGEEADVKDAVDAADTISSLPTNEIAEDAPR